MRGRDLVLALASEQAKGEGEAFPLDRIRMQKAAFLVSMRGTERLRAYDFEPYNWGPYSSELNTDLRDMTTIDLLDLERRPGHQYPEFTTTPAGEDRASKVWAQLEPREQAFLRSVRKFVTGRSFSRLLRDVYAAYPNYATKSQFNG